MPFQPSLMFLGKSGAKRFTRLGSDLKIRLERLARRKHSSLFESFQRKVLMALATGANIIITFFLETYKWAK